MGQDDHIKFITGIVDYLHRYGERAHHRREDAAFARMAHIDKNFKSIADDLHADHDEIIRTARLLIEQRASLEGNAAIKRQALEANTRTCIALQRAHLDREDREIIPNIDGRFDESDWQVVSAEIHRTVETQLSSDMIERYHALGGELTEELTPS